MPYRISCVRVAILTALLQLPAPITMVQADESRYQPGVRESFKFDPEEAWVLIPVRIGGKEYQFVVDTGMPFSVVDSSLKHHLGAPVGKTRGRDVGNGSELQIDTYSSLDATVGSLPFTPETVCCRDLTLMREASGCGIYGFLGLDFLEEWVITVDFDEGRLDILSPTSTPKPEWGECIRVAYKASSIWHIQATLGENCRSSFVMVDTGCSNTGLLEKTLFHQLVDSHRIKVTGEARSAGLAGASSHKVGRVQQFQVGTFEHRNLQVDCGQRDNVLGLGYLRRYRVTLDFPGERIFLAKGKHFADPDHGHMCGTHLLFKKDGILVHSVDEKSPAYAAGVRTKDVLVALSGKPVSELKPSAIRRLLETEGKSVTMTLQRDGKKVDATFTLKEYD